jgi:hypothetical protein
MIFAAITVIVPPFAGFTMFVWRKRITACIFGKSLYGEQRRQAKESK